MINPKLSRRHFSATIAAAFGAAAFAGQSRFGFAHAGHDHGKKTFDISLAQWSYHKALQSGEMDNLDFSKAAKELGIEAVEYVNRFFKDTTDDYLAEVKKRNEDQGVETVLIMVDGEGKLGAESEEGRMKTVDNHKKWVETSKYLGGHSIRVNAGSTGTWEEQSERAADGLAKLSDFAATMDMNVIVENHGGLSSNGKWLSETIKAVGKDNCGTLPDFGNFTIDRKTGESYDKYKGVEELMPFAKAVSAKAYNFDDDGNEKDIDFKRMMQLVLAAGYHGFVGIEYEGHDLPEKDGIIATKKLLEKVREELS